MSGNTIRFLFLFLGFLVLCLLYYLTIVFFDKSIKFGYGTAIIRGMILFVSVAYYALLTYQVSFLRNISRKINQYPSVRRRGGFAIALLLGFSHLIIAFFGIEKFNEYLLNQSGKLTTGFITDCRRDRRGAACLYQFTVSNKSYERQLSNEKEAYKSGDTVMVLYYPAFPAINKIRE